MGVLLCALTARGIQISDPSELVPPATGGEAGRAVAVGLDWVAVGAPFSNVASNTDQGMVYLYTLQTNGNWNYSTSLVASAGMEYDRFGQSLCAWSNTLAVGVSGDDSGGTNAGAVYIFDTDGTNWTQSAKLTAQSPGAGHLFGCSVALDGARLAVGARKYPSGAKPGAGAVYIFDRSEEEGWSETWRVEATEPGEYDYFGCSVALDGDELLVGASDSDPKGSKSGSAYVFGRDYSNGYAWVQERLLVANDGASSDQLGSFVALCNGVAAAGAPGAGDAGAVYIFGRHSGGSNLWGQVDKLLPTPIPSGATFGQSIALDGDFLVSGAPEASLDGVPASGAVFVFEVPNEHEAWGSPTRILLDPPTAMERMGASVALGGSLIAVGSPGCTNSGTNSGAAWLCSVSSDPVPLAMTSIHFKTGMVHVAWSSGTEQRLILEAKAGLADAAWLPLQTNEPPTPPKDSYAEPATTQRFYRVRTETP